jgi:hypothetical protein
VDEEAFRAAQAGGRRKEIKEDRPENDRTFNLIPQ